MSVVLDDSWRADGIDLMNHQHFIEEVSGREVINGKRQPTWFVPFRQGTPPIWDAPHNPKEINLLIVVTGLNASGVVSHGGGWKAHLRENLDELLALFSKRDGTPIALERDVPAVPGPGVQTRTAEVTVIRNIPVNGPPGGAIRRIAVQLFMPWPYWVGGPVTIPTMSPATFNVTGTAITYPTIEFKEPGRLTLEGSSHWVESDSGGVIVDCWNKTIQLNGERANHLVRANHPDWFPLQPGENHVDGPSVNIDYQPQWV